MASYLETTDEKFAAQLDNFASKIDNYTTVFGFTPAEVSSVKADALYYQWAVGNLLKVTTYKQEWTTFKGILRKGETNVNLNASPLVPIIEPEPPAVAPGIQYRFTTMVNRIKAHQNYTSSIGQALGIEAPSVTSLGFDTAKPELKITMRAGKVNLDWKKGKYEGIIIEKDSGNGFVMIDKDLHPNFVDNSPMPSHGTSATWKYRAMYLYNGDSVGLWSEIVSTVVAM